MGHFGNRPLPPQGGVENPFKNRERNFFHSPPPGGSERLRHFALLLGGGLFFVFILPSSLLSEPSSHGFEAAYVLKRYHACIIKNVKSAQSGVAATYLKKACQHQFPSEKFSERAKNKPNQAGVYNLQKREDSDYDAFYNCLLTYLPTVRNDQSANALHQLCKDQFYPVTERSKQDETFPLGANKILQFLGIGQKSPKDSPPHQTIDGDRFVPLTPWQTGNPR